MIKIRRARTAADLSTVHKLYAQTLPEDDAYTNGDAVWWVAEDEEGPCAFAAVTPLTDDPGTAFLARAGVLPRARGAGLQRRLVRVRERWAKRAKQRWLISYVSPDNFPSAANLLRCGYKFYTPAWKWGCEGSLYFFKDLTK